VFRSHEKILKSKRPSFSYPLSNANQIPIAAATLPKLPPVETEIDFVLDSDDEIFYDSMDISDDNDDDEQAPEDDISDLLIKFNPFTIWNNSEDNPVEYILPPHYGKFWCDKIIL
jgi:hypothetical protein